MENYEGKYFVLDPAPKSVGGHDGAAGRSQMGTAVDMLNGADFILPVGIRNRFQAGGLICERTGGGQGTNSPSARECSQLGSF